MGDGLDDLMRRAADADGLDRVKYRDPIAAHGVTAITKLEPLLTDPRLATFAVLTIHDKNVGDWFQSHAGFPGWSPA